MLNKVRRIAVLSNFEVDKTLRLLIKYDRMLITTAQKPRLARVLDNSVINYLLTKRKILLFFADSVYKISGAHGAFALQLHVF